MSATRRNGAVTRGEPETEIHPVNEFPGERVYTEVYPGGQAMQDSIVQYTQVESPGRLLSWLLLVGRATRSFVPGCTYTAIAWMRRSSEPAIRRNLCQKYFKCWILKDV